MMSCTLAALLACFSWSGFYVDTGFALAHQGEGRLVYAPITQTVDDPRRHILPGGTRETVVVPAWSFSSEPQNPYARISVGYSLELNPSTAVRLEASHISSIATGRDHGVDSIELRITWRPFTGD